MQRAVLRRKAMAATALGELHGLSLGRAAIHGDIGDVGLRWVSYGYPLVNIQKTMENHHFEWENPLFLWPFSIAMLNFQRVVHGSPSDGRI